MKRVAETTRIDRARHQDLGQGRVGLKRSLGGGSFPTFGKKLMDASVYLVQKRVKIGVAAGATQRLWMFPLLRIREKGA